MLNLLKKIVAPVTAVVAGLFSVTSANAAGVDFSPVTAGVDVSTVVTAIVALGAIMILPGVAKWAVRKLMSFAS